MLYIKKGCVCIFLCLTYHWHPSRSIGNPRTAEWTEANKLNIRNNSENSQRPDFLHRTIPKKEDDSNETTTFTNRDDPRTNETLGFTDIGQAGVSPQIRFNFTADVENHTNTALNLQVAPTGDPSNLWMFDPAGISENDPFCFFNLADRKYPKMSNISECDIDLTHRYNHSVSEWSCSGRCHLNQSVFNESGVTCFCDSLCLLYNSCCEDFQTECLEVDGVARYNKGAFGNSSAVCSSFVRAQLISKCPNNYPDLITKRNCESVEHGNTTEFIFPVTDSSSGHHFKNKACWKCWSMPGDALAWTVSVTIASYSWHDNQYDPQNILSLIQNQPRRSQWKPPDGYRAYFCDSCAVTSCTGCRNEHLQSLCSNVFSFVEIDGLTYKNKYCYSCSEEFVLGLGSDGDVEAKYTVPEIPSRWRREDEGYNYFEFNVIAILRGDVMTIEAVKPEKVSFDWTRVECQSGKPNCVASACFGPFVKSNEICNPSLFYGTLQVTVCLSVDVDPLNTCDFAESNKPASVDFLKSFKEKVKIYFERGLEYQNGEILKTKIDEAIQVPAFELEFAGNMVLTTDPLFVSGIVFMAASDVYTAFTHYKNAVMCFGLFTGIGNDVGHMATRPDNCHSLFAVSKSHAQFYSGSFLFVLATVATFQQKCQITLC